MQFPSTLATNCSLNKAARPKACPTVDFIRAEREPRRKKEKDIDVEMDLYGGKGDDKGSYTGGEGGYSRIQFTMTKNQEYVIVDGSKPIISNLYPDENIKDVISDYTFQAIIEDSIIGLGPNLETVTSNIKFVIDGHSFQPNLKYLGYGKWQASLTISLSEDIHTWKLLSLDAFQN